MLPALCAKFDKITYFSKTLLGNVFLATTVEIKCRSEWENFEQIAAGDLRRTDKMAHPPFGRGLVVVWTGADGATRRNSFKFFYTK